MSINALVVGYVHLKWETISSISLRRELNQLAFQYRPITVDYGWFKCSVDERFKLWHIQFVNGPVPAGSSAHKLTSVVEGYPNQVVYKVNF